jgi:hypothetical protein
VIVAVAGRLVDAEGASPRRFPVASVERVGADIEATLRHRKATAVVCSAACGADLLAADAAARLEIPAHIVLPFEVRRFRETSVTSRGGNWGPIFDRVLSRASAAGDLLVLANADEHAAFEAATREILNQAEALAAAAGGPRVLALAVWEGASRGDHDLTAVFLSEAARREWDTTQILTT